MEECGSFLLASWHRLLVRLRIFEIVLNRMACTNAGCERGRRMLCTHMQARRITASPVVDVEFGENAIFEKIHENVFTYISPRESHIKKD